MEYQLDAKEEIILLAMQEALSSEMNEIIEKINTEKCEKWLKPLDKIAIGEYDNTFEIKPAALITIKKVKKSLIDLNIDISEYILTLRITFSENEEKYTPYRYAAALEELFKQSKLLPAVADRVTLFELDYSNGTKNGTDEPEEAEYKIRLIREGF